MSTSRPLPTLDDVARAAGVSTATVSRCLNSPDRVLATTRTKVLAAVERLGYTPHFGARTMAGRRTFTIGAIIPTMENAIFARGLQAFQEALHQRGYTLLVASSGYSADVEAEQINALVSRGADGLLLIGNARSSDVYETLKRRSVASLILWTSDPKTPQPCIGFDNRAAMATLTEAVMSQGHRRIAMIAGKLEGNDRALARYHGVRDVLARHGLDPNAMPLVQAPYDIDSGADGFAHLMAAAPRPTAILCGNDVLAVGAMARARDIGIRIPQDVSITGFDDLELARIVSPALTTVSVPHRDMGRRAAEALVNMLETGTPASSVVLECELKVRASLGAPAD
ncbi:MAG: LacI family DNA-binding transcriptional regulator [Pseudomonadota bacterium]